MIQQTYQTYPRYNNDVGIAKEILLKAFGSKIQSFRITSPEEDLKFAADIVLNGNIRVAIRRRRYSPGGENFRGITVNIRKDNSTAMPEIVKIKKGFVTRYLRLWDNKDGKIEDWAYVDLERMVKLDMFSKRPEKRVIKDGSYFIEIPVSEIEAEDCLLAGNVWGMETLARNV